MHYIRISMFLILSLRAYLGLNGQESDQLKSYEVKILESNLAKKADAINVEIAKNNYTKGNAGLTPNVTLDAGDNVSYTANVNESANGVTKNGFKLNNSISAGVFGNMTLYNGGRNQNLYERFKILVDAADLNQREISENLIYQVRSLYYQAIRQKQLIKTTQVAIEYSRQRLQLASNKLEIGTGNKVEVLQAQLDQNEYLTNIENYKVALDNISIQINTLMNLPTDTSIIISDTPFVLNNINKEEIMNSFTQRNVELMRNRINYALALNKEADIRGLLKPTILGSLGYSYTRADNGGGFFRVNSSNGLAGGVTISIPIYDGKAIKSQIKNAELETKQIELSRQNTEIQLLSNLEQYYRNYQNSINLTKLQEDNVKNAEENISIGLARFQVGVTNGFEFKQIQQSYTDANFRYIDALYLAKSNELELLYLSGNILNQ